MKNTTKNHKVQLRAKLRRFPKSVGFILAKYAKYVMATHPIVVEVFQAGTERCVLPFFQHNGILFSPVLTVTMVLFSSGRFSTVAVDVNCDVQRAAGTVSEVSHLRLSHWPYLTTWRPRRHRDSFMAEADKSQKAVTTSPTYAPLKSTHARTFSCSRVKCPIAQRWYVPPEVQRQTAGPEKSEQIRCHI